MPNAGEAKTLLEFFLNTYGATSLLLIGACAYFAWALYKEQLNHQRTRDMLASGQDKAVQMQLQYVQVLAELKALIEARVKG